MHWRMQLQRLSAIAKPVSFCVGGRYVVSLVDKIPPEGVHHDNKHEHSDTEYGMRTVRVFRRRQRSKNMVLKESFWIRFAAVFS